MINKLLSPYRGLPKGVYVIFFATVLNNLGNFVAPVLTLLMKDKLGIDVGIVGVIIALNGLLGLAGSLIGGKLIDSIGRKSVFIFFRVLAAFALMLCIIIDNNMLMVVTLMFANFTTGIASPVFNTIMTDITDEDERKAAFSLRYMGINVGYAVGPIIATQLYRMNQMKLLFLGDALTVIGSVLLVVLFISESKPEVMSDHNKDKDLSLYQAMKAVPVLLYFSMISVLFFVVFSQFGFGMPITMTEVLGENGAGHYGVMLSINAMICTFLTVPLTSLTKNIRPARSIQYGGILYAIGFGAYGWVTSVAAFYAFTAVWTIGEILIATNTSVFIANHAPITHRGRFNAIFPIIRRVGSFLGPIIAGVVLKLSNISVLWAMIGIIATFAAIGMDILQKSYPILDMGEKV